MKTYELTSSSITVGTPVLVGSAAGHHWFATLHPAGGQDMFCEVVLSDDTAQGKWPACLYLSQDMGNSWQRTAEIDSYGPTSVLLGQGHVLLMPYELWPLSPGDKKNAIAEGTVITRLADAVKTEPTQVRFLGMPRDLADYHEGELALLTNGNILELQDGRHLMTVYGRFAGSDTVPNYECFAMTSADRGLTWRYLSHVAGWQDTPEATEGPSESNTARLGDGRLMCVYRVGSGREQHFHASYSADDGVSWTGPTALPAQWSVEPQLVCLGDGTLLLSGGRPGVWLWVDRQGAGESWEAINLAAHHNAAGVAPALHFAASCVDGRGPAEGEPAFTTSYTCMKQIGTNEVMLCYDRLGNGWEGGPGLWGPEDSVFAVRVQVNAED